MLERSFITLIPPALSLLTGLALAVLSLARGRRNPENILFSMVCIWISMLAPVFIVQHFIEDPRILIRIDRSIHLFYVFLPPIFLLFFHRTVGLQRPLLTAGAFVLSLGISLFTQSNAYIADLNRYGWGSIAKGGPVFTLFGAYSFAVLLYSIWSLASNLKQETNPVARLKKAYVLIGFLVTGGLTLGNMPSISGVDVYPTGNFMFIPLAVMGYGVLKHRLLDIPAFLFNVLFWITLIIGFTLPNLLGFLFAYRPLSEADPVVLFTLLMLWFPANVFYVRGLRNLLEPIFHRTRTDLEKEESRFLESILLLRNREDLHEVFARILERTLLIAELTFYENSDEPKQYLGPEGRRLTISSALKAWFLARRTPVQRSLVETSPQDSPVRGALMACFQGSDNRYLLPLVANDELVGLYFLGPRADGREIRPEEARFLQNMLPVLSTAIANAMLYQSVSDLKDTLEERSTALIREMAEKKRAEVERRKSDEKYRMVTEKVSDVIWIINPETWTFEYVSPSVQRLLGYTAEEMKSISLQEIVTPEAMNKCARLLAEEVQKEYEGNQDPERSRTFEVDHIPKNGPTLPAEVTTSFLRDSSGGITGVLGVTRDIRERKRLETQLRTARKMEAIGTLAGGVAHDLNNILSGITSYPELLLMDLPEESPLHKPIQTIKKSGEKATAIVQDLLTLARRSESVKEVLNLNDLVTEYLASPEFEVLLAHHPDVKVTTDLSPTLQPISASRVHLLKVVMNMVSNAAEAMPDGGSIHIRTGNEEVRGNRRGTPALRDGRRVVLQVSDTGLGIDPEDLERIFEPFYTKKKMGRSGTGLGMAVVWGTIQDHDGTIDVDSQPGEGTTFTIHLPAVDGTPAPEKPDASLEALMGNQETVLIVDDVPEQREIAASILQKLNYRVRTAASGEEAVEQLRSEPADLVLLDMIMSPGMDGLATYRRILDLHPGQKALPVSGFSETHQVREVLSLGAGRYVRKPYTLETIGKAVKETLERP